MDLASLSKATIVNTVTAERLSVMYNPEEFRLEQGNTFAEVGIPGLEAPPLQYVRGKLRSLSMDLFWDTYEQQRDVRSFSDQIVSLLNKHPRTMAPPVLLFTMGQFAFECVLVDVSQTFTMFLPDGTPVRATQSVSFQEFSRASIEAERGLFLGPPTLHNAGPTQTLSDLAGDYLGNPALWREIAEANGIDDPLNIEAGLALIIPEALR